jgi:hypothetical protein
LKQDSRQQQDEFVEHMYLVYNDFNEMVKSEGIHNVLTDLENVYPELYSNLIQEVIKRHNIKKNGTLLTKC